VLLDAGEVIGRSLPVAPQPASVSAAYADLPSWGFCSRTSSPADAISSTSR